MKLKTKKEWVIALDIGGTKINAGLVNPAGQITTTKKIATPKKGRKIEAELIKLTSSFWQPKIKKIGLGIAGQISWPDGLIINSPNIPALNGHNLKPALNKKFKVPVIIDNDVHGFVLAENLFGAARGFKYVVGVSLGTGIGGAIAINEKILRGKNNGAGEFGHTFIVNQGFKCACGHFGHWEAQISGTAMINTFLKITGKKLDTFAIESLYYKKNQAAKKTFDLMSDYLARGLANIINSLDPEIIVLGGGLIRVKPIWRTAIKKYLPKYLLHKKLKGTKIAPTQLGDQAMILGIALIAMKESSTTNKK